MSHLDFSNCNSNGNTTHEWEYGTYEFDEQNLSSANSTTEESSTNDNEYIPGTFEGPEKTLEVIYKAGIGAPNGLRNMTRDQLDTLCTAAKCTILSVASTDYLDAYVLSESSLFVYEYRLIMKTCGTTTLLRCLSTLFEYSDKLDMQLSWVGYSRKNFLFPSAQLWPHVNFGEEMRYIEQHEALQQRLRGDGHILGPVTGDHWFVYVAEGSPVASKTATPMASRSPAVLSASTSTGDFSQAERSGSATPTSDNHTDEEDTERRARTKPVPSRSLYRAPTINTAALAQAAQERAGTYRTVNLMMFDMHPDVAATFFQGTNGLTGKQMTAKAGIQELCPGAYVDEAAFTPCGYSMNAVKDNEYSTIHITPEAECSYCSFETNAQLEDYAPLVRKVLATFRPQRFVLTMFGDDSAIDNLSRLPTQNRTYGDIDQLDGVYQRSSSTCTNLESQRQHCVMACYSYLPFDPLPLPVATPLFAPVVAPLRSDVADKCAEGLRKAMTGCDLSECQLLNETEDDEEQKEMIQ
eukprot:gene13571-15617_t